MDVAYVCEWEKRPKSNHCPSIPLVCAWSCRNLVAFTTDLKNEEEKDLTHMIHIIDTEHPWDIYSINSGHNEVITCLEWDQSGSRLLSADADGQIKCWGMAEHLVNGWESSLGSAVEGDPIVALSWLHNGVKLALHVEKSGSSNFGEKFSRVKFSPSLTLFGGKPMEGWMAVTVSGLVSVSLLKPNGTLLTASESLCRLRGRVALADIAFTGGGNIVVAATDGSSSSPVQFYKVCVGVVNEKCRIDTELLPSLFMRCTTDPARKDKYPAVTHLKFLTRENSEQVLLCASSQLGSIVECWSLRKEGLPVNNIFQHRSPVVGEKQPMILKWRILSATSDLDRVSAVALPKLPISISNTDLKVASDTKFCPGLGLALAFHDGSIHIVHRLSLQTMGVFYSSSASSQRGPDEPALKRQRPAGTAGHFKALQLSWTSLALVGIDNHGKLHMLRVSPSMGHTLDMNTSLRHLLFLLEYCMVTGYDWWDILLHVQPGMVHNLVDKLHEEYMRQNQALQQGSLVRPGFGFLRDGPSLGMLREMMVVIRIWGLLKPGCLPIYTATSDNQDSMSLLFRLLTKLWLCSRDENHPSEPDDSLIDECCLLPSQLLVPHMDWLPVNDGVVSKLQNKQPLRLQFGKPYSLPGLGSGAPVEIFSRTPGSQRMDNLRCLHLGVCPTEDSKACTRVSERAPPGIEGGLQAHGASPVILVRESETVMRGERVCLYWEGVNQGDPAVGNQDENRNMKLVRNQQVGFRCHDRSLSMPYVDSGDELIPLLMLLSLAFAGPAASIMLGEGLLYCLQSRLKLRPRVEGSINAGGCNFNSFLRRTVRFVGVHVFGLCATALVTDVIQLATGYHAPFFLTVCKPNYTMPGVSCDSNPYITRDICAGSDQHAIVSARYLVLPPNRFIPMNLSRLMYFNSTISDSTKLLKPMLVFAFAIAAGLCGLTQITQYRSHAIDVYVGFFIGAGIAAYLARPSAGPGARVVIPPRPVAPQLVHIPEEAPPPSPKGCSGARAKWISIAEKTAAAVPAPTPSSLRAANQPRIMQVIAMSKQQGLISVTPKHSETSSSTSSSSDSPLYRPPSERDSSSIVTVDAHAPHHPIVHVSSGNGGPWEWKTAANNGGSASELKDAYELNVLNRECGRNYRPVKSVSPASSASDPDSELTTGHSELASESRSRESTLRRKTGTGISGQEREGIPIQTEQDPFYKKLQTGRRFKE
ncbi:UNVERIFIED_CONTAM: hypothetical protein FKN15_027138 [Acipenser sinensis]